MIYAGPNLGDFRFRSEKDLEQFERVAQGGARVLILFQTKETRYEKVRSSQTGCERSLPKKVRPSLRKKRKPRVDTMLKRWGVEEAGNRRAKRQAKPKTSKHLTPSIIRRDVLWHFAKWDPRWKPVLVEPRRKADAVGAKLRPRLHRLAGRG